VRPLYKNDFPGLPLGGRQNTALNITWGRVWGPWTTRSGAFVILYIFIWRAFF